MSGHSPQGAFALSLGAGLLMLLGGGISLVLSGGERLGYSTLEGMMGGYGTTLGSMGGLFVGLVAGLMVTVGALLLNSRPAEHVTWGALILVFSLIGFLGMDALFIGAILGVVGGAIALSWRSTREERFT